MAIIPEYNATPWSLPVGCYSIIVKHDAIHRSFPGGVKAFEHMHRPIRKSWVLYLLMALTRDAADRLVARLAEDGLKPGVDVAVADKLRRPIQECLGVAFIDHGRHQWSVDLALDTELPAHPASHERVSIVQADPALTSFASEGCLTLRSEARDEPGTAVQGYLGYQYTSVSGLTRKADRRRFIEDLERAMVRKGLIDAVAVLERDGHTSLHLSRPELSALISFSHARRQAVPMIHWHGAQSDLLMVPKAWSSINQFHRRKATSFPKDLNDVIRSAVVGLRSAKDGTAFLLEDER